MLSEIRKSFKHWTCTLTINGQPYTIVDRLPSRSMALDQARSVCTVVVQEFPECNAGDPAQVRITINGVTELFFTGQVAARPIADIPQYEIHLVDTLDRLQRITDRPIVWRNVSFQSAVRLLLHQAGITDDEIVSIHDPGSAYVLGPIYAITIPAGSVIRDVIDTLMDFAGTAIRVNPDGRIVVVDDPIKPSVPVCTYAYGATELELGYLSARRTIAGREDRISRFTARGPRRPDLSIPDATYVLNNDGRSEQRDYPYCQTDICAQAIAAREIVRRNRRMGEVLVEATLNPLLRPGDTVLFRSEPLGFVTATPGVIVSIVNNDDVMTMKVAVGIESPSGSLSLIAPPTASFTYSAERQPIQLSGAVDTNVIVSCMNTSVDPSGFAITTLRWRATCEGTVFPQTVTWRAGDDDTGQQPIFVFSTLAGATVTLEVESESGEGATTTRAIDPPNSLIYTRKLGVAAHNGWRVLATADGWRTFGTQCSAVPNINDMAPFLAGFDNGDIYRTNNDLATQPDKLATLSGRVHSLYLDEVDGLTVTAAHGNSVSLSTDGGTSWALLHVFDDPVQYAAHEAGNWSVIRACSGNTLWLSLDAGRTWQARLTADGIARQFARARWGTACVFAGGTLDQAIQFEDESSVDWSLIPIDKRPIFGLTAIAPLLREEGWIVGSDGVRDVTRDGVMEMLAYAATTGSGYVYKLIRDGNNWRAVSYTYIPGGGVWKIINYTTAHSIDANVSMAYRIGYGTTTDPPTPPELLFLPMNGSTLYHYIPGSGWTPRPLPSTPIGSTSLGGSNGWAGIAINPQNVTQWVIWDRDRYYWSGDSGNTWQQLNVPVSSGDDATGINLGFAFTGQGGGWVATKHFYSIYGTGYSLGYLAYGNGTRVQEYVALGDLRGQPVPPIQFVDNFRSFQQVLTGHQGEMLVRGANQRRITEFGVRMWIPNADRLFLVSPRQTTVVQDVPFHFTLGDTVDDMSRKLIVVHDLSLWISLDYRTMPPQQLVAAGGSVVSCLHGLYCGHRIGVARVTNIDNVPEVTIVIAHNRPVGQVVRGRRRVAVAAFLPAHLTAPPQIAYYNGSQWGIVDTPVASGGLIALVEP